MPFFVMESAPEPMTPEMAILPVPPRARLKAPLTPPAIVRVLAELLVQPWAAFRIKLTLELVFPMVTAPAPEFTSMPLAKRFNVFVVVELDLRVVVPVLLNTNPRADAVPLKVMVSAPLSVFVLKTTKLVLEGAVPSDQLLVVLQTPPPGVVFKVVVNPTHTFIVPVIAVGVVLIN